MKGVVFVDVDGTLVPETSSSQHLARHLGHLTLLSAAEAAYADGRMTNRQVSLIDAAGWANVAVSQIERLLVDLPLLDGISEVVAWCRERRLSTYLATLAWTPVGQYLCGRFGFDGACGPRPEISGGRYTGAVAGHFDEFDKRDFARETAASLGVSLSCCSAVGDSRSDLPIFEEVAFSVGFNASAAVKARANANCTGGDLRAVIPLLADWLGRLESYPTQ